MYVVSPELDYRQTKRISSYYVKKLFRKFKQVKGKNFQIWVREVNPSNSKGPEVYECKIVLKTPEQTFFAEKKGSKVRNCIRDCVSTLMRKIPMEKLDKRRLRNFKRTELVRPEAKLQETSL
jgi:hypothetical protein